MREVRRTPHLPHLIDDPIHGLGTGLGVELYRVVEPSYSRLRAMWLAI